jgi:hypothetical protein
MKLKCSTHLTSCVPSIKQQNYRRNLQHVEIQSRKKKKKNKGANLIFHGTFQLGKIFGNLLKIAW